MILELRQGTDAHIAMLPGQDGRVTHVAAFVPDLMDRSRIGAAIAGVDFVASASELVGHPAETVILDLGRPGVLEVLPALTGKRTVGFASHVDAALISAAAAAGCTQVLARSRFFSDIAAVITAPPDPAIERG